MSRSRLAVAAAATALLLGGCGGSDDSGSEGPELESLSAAQLLDKAKTAIESEPSVSLTGEGTDGDTTIAIDMSYVEQDAEGSIAVGGDELRILRVDDENYFKAEDSFWQTMGGDQADLIIATIDGRWIRTSGEADFVELVSFAGREFMTNELLEPETPPEKGEPETVEGVDCLTLTSDSGTLYLAADDGRPIQIESQEEGNLMFSYDEQEAPEAPAESDVIASSELG